MKYLLILEGPDRCGKTEIGQALAKKLNISYFKNSTEHDSFVNETFCVSAFVEAQYFLDFISHGFIPKYSIEKPIKK